MEPSRRLTETLCVRARQGSLTDRCVDTHSAAGGVLTWPGRRRGRRRSMNEKYNAMLTEMSMWKQMVKDYPNMSVAQVSHMRCTTAIRSTHCVCANTTDARAPGCVGVRLDRWPT